MFYIDFCIIYGTNRDSSDTDRSVPSVEGLIRRIIGSLQQQQAGGQSATSSQVASVSLGPLPRQNPEGDALGTGHNLAGWWGGGEIQNFME